MKKIKILYLVSAIKYCGPITVLHGIIKGLDISRFEIYLLSLSKGESGPVIDWFKELNIHLITLNHSRPKGLLFNNKIIRDLIKNQNIDLVHSHGFRADMINSKLKQVTSLTTIHNFPNDDYTYRYGKLIGAVMAIKHISIIRNLDFTIACSKSICEKIKSFYGIQTFYVQNGIDTEKYAPVKKDKNELRKILNLPENKIIYIVSGALSKLKNPVRIIDAFDKLKGHDHLVIFLGKGNQLNALITKNNNSNIRFLGSVKNVNDYLKASDFYISASLTEGMPNSVLEALSSGLPSILSNIPSHTEIVGKIYPYLFDPNETDDLLKKIQAISWDDNAQRTAQLLLKIKINFSCESMAQKYQDYYLTSFKSPENKVYD